MNHGSSAMVRDPSVDWTMRAMTEPVKYMTEQLKSASPANPYLAEQQRVAEERTDTKILRTLERIEVLLLAIRWTPHEVTFTEAVRHDEFHHTPRCTTGGCHE